MAKIILKKNKVGRPTFSSFKTYNRIVGYWHRIDKHINGIELRVQK
jgi:hypothetical protein